MNKIEKEKVKLWTVLEGEHPLEKLKCEELHIGGVVFRCGSVHESSFRGSCMAGSKKSSLGNMSFSNCEFYHSNWNGSYLPETSFYACHMNEMDMNGVYMAGSIICMSKAVSSKFQRACMRGTVFNRTNLDYSDMKCSDLGGAMFRGCSIVKVDFNEANLYNSTFIDCQLRAGVDMSDCDLRNALFRNCDLSGAVLSRADLRGARFIDCALDGLVVEDQEETRGLDEAFPSECPAQGSFVAYKMASREPDPAVKDEEDSSVIVALHVPEDAKRVSSPSGKCRCDKAKVVGITEIGGAQAYDKDGNALTKAVSFHDSSFVYELGKTVEVKDFDDIRFHECSTGIHFFMTRELAEAY